MNRDQRTLIIPVFLAMCTIGLQKTQAQPDQVELMKQFIGTWSTDMIGKDTGKLIVVITPFGSTMEGSVKLIVRGKTTTEGRWLWGYNPEYNKFIAAELTSESPVMKLFTYSFTSKNTAEKIVLGDVPADDPTMLISRFEFKTPDLIIQTVSRNGKTVNSFSITRVKN